MQLKPTARSEAAQEKVLAALEAPFELQLMPSNVKGAMKEHGAGSSDLWKVPYESIRVIEGFQPKIKNDSYMEHVREIADSMKEVGWLPNSVLAGYVATDAKTGEAVIFVTDGHTRLLALEIAIKEGSNIAHRVPVIVQPTGTSMADLNVQLIRGHKDRALSPYETGVVLKRLLADGYSDKEVQAMTGVKDPWYGSLMRLMAAPKKLKNLVAFETISATFAIDMIDKHDGNALALIEQGLAQKIAQAKGSDGEPSKVRLTGRNMPKSVDEKVERAITKFSPVMHSTIERVFKDPGFASLGEETRGLLEQLVSEFQGVKAGIEKKAAKAKVGGQDAQEVAAAAAAENPRQNKLFQGAESSASSAP